MDTKALSHCSVHVLSNIFVSLYMMDNKAGQIMLLMFAINYFVGLAAIIENLFC